MIEADKRIKIVVKWDTCSNEDEGISFYTKDGRGTMRERRHHQRSDRQRDEREFIGRNGTEKKKKAWFLPSWTVHSGTRLRRADINHIIIQTNACLYQGIEA